MEADRRAALVEQGKALKQQLTDLEVSLQQLENRLQVRILLICTLHWSVPFWRIILHTCLHWTL